MPGTKAELISAFQAAVAAFNAQDETIGGLLEENVAMIRVSKPDKPPIVGIKDVQNYLAKDFKYDNPSFNNPNYGIMVNGKGTTGVIKGTAAWNDDNGPETINFVFMFVYDENAGKWLISWLWGH